MGIAETVCEVSTVERLSRLVRKGEFRLEMTATVCEVSSVGRLSRLVREGEFHRGTSAAVVDVSSVGGLPWSAPGGGVAWGDVRDIV